MANELSVIIQENELEETKAGAIIKSFSGFLEDAKKFESEAMAIVITSEDQVDDMKKAREIRLKLKNLRVNAENTRKGLKDQALREGRAIDGVANIIKAVIVPLEDHLEEQEKFIERLEAEKRQKLIDERVSLLAPYVTDVSFYNLDISQEGFDGMLKDAKAAFESAKENERKAEEERLAREKEEAAEQERIRKENEVLKAEAEAKEKELADERSKAEESQRLANEARDKAESELKAREEADKKAEQERLDRETREKEESANTEKLAKYQNFLKKNGVTNDTKPLFYFETSDEEVRLYKLIDTFVK